MDEVIEPRADNYANSPESRSETAFPVPHTVNLALLNHKPNFHRYSRHSASSHNCSLEPTLSIDGAAAVTELFATEGNFASAMEDAVQHEL